MGRKRHSHTPKRDKQPRPSHAAEFRDLAKVKETADEVDTLIEAVNEQLHHERKMEEEEVNNEKATHIPRNET